MKHEVRENNPDVKLIRKQLGQYDNHSMKMSSSGLLLLNTIVIQIALSGFTSLKTVKLNRKL